MRWRRLLVCALRETKTTAQHRVCDTFVMRGCCDWKLRCVLCRRR